MPSETRDSDTLAVFGWPTYFIALLMVVTPAVDFVTNVWPLKPSDLPWRYGTVGLLSGFLLTPLLGAVLACLAAQALRHRVVQRVLAGLNALSALLLFAAFVLFALDVLQYRRAVPQEALATFDVGSLKAEAKHLTTAVAFAWLAMSGWSASRRAGADRRHG